MSDYKPVEYISEDGLRLFARDYPCHPDAPVVLCLHGLTRNSADFEPLCDLLAADYRLIVPDQRGRGQSQWDNNPENYQPLRYSLDMFSLLDHLEIKQVAIIGTSMGGIMGMIMAVQQRARIKGLVLNDIGAEIDLEGVRQIAGVVSQPPRYKSWEEAEDTIRRNSALVFPDFSPQQWHAFTRRTCKQVDGGVVPDYDPAIGSTFANAGNAAAPDLWPAFNQLADLPMLLIRGATSNILKASTCEAMRARHPGLEFIELANRGHAPILDEPPAVAAIQSFLHSFVD